MENNNEDTQNGGLPVDAAAGNTDTQITQEKPSINVEEIVKQNSQLTKKVNELLTTLDTISLRDKEEKLNSNKANKDAESEILTDQEALDILQLPASEAKEALKRLTKKQSENFQKRLDSMQESTIQKVMSQTKLNETLSKIQNKIKEQPHLAPHVELIMKEGAFIYHSERGLTPEQAVEKVVQKFQSSFDAYAKAHGIKTDEPTKTDKQKDEIPSGAVSETAGIKTQKPPAKKEENFPKTDAEWFEQETERRRLRNSI